MRKDDVSPTDDDVRPEYDDSALKGGVRASISIGTVPGPTCRC